MISDDKRVSYSYKSFKSFNNHARFSRIHANCPGVTWIWPRLIRLYVRFTRVANHINRVLVYTEFILVRLLAYTRDDPELPGIKSLIHNYLLHINKNDTKRKRILSTFYDNKIVAIN